MILQNIISLQTPFRRDKSRDPIKTTWEFITKVSIALVFHDHVGFPLRPFTDLLCIHGYHPTLYTAISRKVVGKTARDNPERHCGWF